MRITDFTGQVAAVDGYEEFVGSVSTAGDFDSDFNGDVLSDDALDSVVQPAAGTTQVVDMELWVNGVLVQRSDLMDQMVVERDYDNLIQVGRFQNPLFTPEGVFGTPWACLGPAIGKGLIQVKGLYATPAGVYRINLLSEGIAAEAEREAGEDGIYEVFEFGDGVARYDGVKVTKQFPPGHGLYRGRVFREIVKALGDDKIAFEDGGRMDIELQLVDSLPIPTMGEIAEVENRRILKDSEGYWRNPRVGRIRPDESPVFTFDEGDLLRAATVRQRLPNNPITLVIAKGERQKTKENCGDVNSVETQYFFETPYTYKRSLYRQETDGTYTSLPGLSPTLTPVLVRKIETRRLRRCDVLIDETIKTWELTRRETPRHTWEAGADPELEDGWRSLQVYTDDNSGVGGGPAYMDQTEVFLLVSVQRTKIHFNHKDYVQYIGSLPSGSQWDVLIQEPPAAAYASPAFVAANPEAESLPTYGQAQGSVVFFSRLGHIEGSIKEKEPTEQWEDIEPETDQLIWGNGGGVNAINSGVTLHAQRFLRPDEAQDPADYDVLMPWSITTTVFFGDDKNFLTKQKVHQHGWRAPRGSRYFYGENDSRSEQSQSFLHTDTETITYSATGSSHSETISTDDIITGKNHTNVKNGLPGNLPPIDKLDIVAINSSIYEDGEQDEFAKKAGRTDTETVTVTVPFNFFLTCHLPREVTVDFPWAENRAELQAMAEALAQESAAQPVFFTLPANFLIREAMPIHLIYRPFDIDHDLRVKRLKWARSPETPILTEVECRLYPF
jgi:hypothetical protein